MNSEKPPKKQEDVKERLIRAEKKLEKISEALNRIAVDMDLDKNDVIQIIQRIIVGGESSG